MRRALLITAPGGLLAWLMVGTGFANYDTAYALLWGEDLAHGRAPDYDLPLIPTPHPLATLFGLVLSPLGGDAAETVWVVAAVVFLGALTWLTYALGARWFGPAAGALAAVIVITREPILSYGIRAYVDIPYVALILGALLVEARRPRSGGPVLALLAVAGLIRPEAWLLSAAYVAYLAYMGERARLGWLIGLAAAAPVLWALTDLITTGDPLHSLTGTREGAETLERKTGLVNVVLVGPRRIGEILREPVLLGAVAGGALAWWRLRARTRLPIAAGIAALVAFAILAAAGLPILARYLIFPAALLAIACGAGAFGWLLLPRDDEWRARWRAIGIVVLLALVAFTPRQVDRIDALHAAIRTQREIRDDLQALADTPAMRSSCGPIAVPNHRPVPLLALWLGRRPGEIVSAQLSRPRLGLYVDPASARVERNFTLDRNDPKRLTAAVPPGFRPVERNRSWILYRRCG